MKTGRAQPGASAARNIAEAVVAHHQGVGRGRAGRRQAGCKKPPSRLAPAYLGGQHNRVKQRQQAQLLQFGPGVQALRVGKQRAAQPGPARSLQKSRRAGVQTAFLGGRLPEDPSQPGNPLRCGLRPQKSCEKKGKIRFRKAGPGGGLRQKPARKLGVSAARTSGCQAQPNAAQASASAAKAAGLSSPVRMSTRVP